MLRILLLSLLSLWVLNAKAQTENSLSIGRTDSVLCKQNPEQSYALFLPSNYNATQNFPVIYFFEPLARGSLPVQKYQTLAEYMGIILIGSNNSKNGSWEKSFKAAENMIQDSMNRLSIDSSQIVVSGFSGGARVAFAIARLLPNVDGIIACGAGNPNLSNYIPKTGNNQKTAVICGRLDMNYTEVEQVYIQLKNKAEKSVFLTSDYGHQWPDTTLMQGAFLYHFNRNPAQKAIASSYYKYFIKKIESNNAKNWYFENVQLLEALLQFELFDDNSLKTQKEGIIALKQYQKNRKSYNKQIKEEHKEQALLLDAFEEMKHTQLKVFDSVSKTMEWWTLKIKNFRNTAQHKNRFKRRQATRLLNVIAMHCAVNAHYYAKAGNHSMAIKLAEIWLKTNPNGYWPLLSLSRYYYANQEFEKAIQTLEHLCNAGYRNKQFNDNNGFKALESYEKFLTLKARIRSAS